MTKRIVRHILIALAGVICLFLLSEPPSLHAATVTSVFTFENDGDLTDSPFGTLEINDNLLNTLEFEVLVDTGKLGTGADIHEFGFMLNYSGDVIFNFGMPDTGFASVYDKVQGRNSFFDYVVNFGAGSSKSYQKVSFSLTGSGVEELTIEAISSAGMSSQKNKTDAQFMMHVQNTATPSGSEAVGGFYRGAAPVPVPPTILLLGAGLVGVAGSSLRKKKQ